MTTPSPTRTAPVDAASSPQPLLAVQGLHVAYGRSEVVTDVDFAIARGESLALIGESGSGKSTIARAILRLLPRDLGRTSGSVRFGDDANHTEILSVPERRFRRLRGREIGFIPQDPGNSFNPVRTIGAHAKEAVALMEKKVGAAEGKELVLDTLAGVGLTDPRRVYESYPHELSGGMLQRVLIGLTVLPRPRLIVADEPTSALDVTIQKRILDLLAAQQHELGSSLLLITHDLAIAADRTDAIVVLKDGRVQEVGRTRQVFAAPVSDYARKLHADVPALNPDRYRAVRDAAPPATAGAAPKIEFRSITKEFVVDGRELYAVDDATFKIAAGSTHALVGESGSGKTTSVRMLLGLETPTEGEVLLDGKVVSGRTHADLREIRRHLQFVYQNPFTSLDPSWRIDRIVREPLDRYAIGSRAERESRVREAIAGVGLGEHLLSRRPGALSGGQRQRVAIARALVLRPDVIVLDEPTSALDVTVQADILDVLVRLQAELGLTYVFVSHDLAIVRQIADTVTVMNGGRVVEHGPVNRVLAHPHTDYTRDLIAAIPGRTLIGTPDVEPVQEERAARA